jgi:predicted amidophosphoribosyltransferase
MDCPRCSSAIKGNERYCPACNSDVGYPNVRAAQEPAEKVAIANRYKRALESASKRGCSDGLIAFL